jgi:hypothetical protein
MSTARIEEAHLRPRCILLLSDVMKLKFATDLKTKKAAYAAFLLFGVVLATLPATSYQRFGL